MSGSRGRSRYLLPQEQLNDLAARFLKPPKHIPDGQEESEHGLEYAPFAKALEQAILEFFTSSPALKTHWENAQPIALGSWARGELCPKSDLDILFAGNEEAAAAVTRTAQEAGIKIRSRIPENADDWSVGVEPFDVLALLAARPLTKAGQFRLEREVQSLEKTMKSWRRRFFQAIRRERQERAERSNSIAGFLEPNLKSGPGGLRDMGQAIQVRRLFPERFESPERAHALQVYDYYRRFFLISRARVQLSEGGGDLLSAYEQPAIADWFGFENARDYMREIQKGLSRVSFYADVDFEQASVAERDLKVERRAVDLDFVELANLLEREPSILVQAKARDIGFKLFRQAVRKNDTEKSRANAALTRLMVRATDPQTSEDLAIAIFRSRWIDLAVTDFKKIVGYVQHDQYHRYTVDAHLLQAIREMKRVAQRPTVLGRLKAIAQGLTSEDWRILGWSALYHDVGKGSGGDHSDRSVVIAKSDLERWGVSEESRAEIVWLIENHLELSTAAFRGNPAHPTTWRALHAKGIQGKRLHRLAIFTAVDILATNREAYTPWKERLLFDLVGNLERPEAIQLAKLEKRLREPKGTKTKKTSEKKQEWLGVLDRLDPFVVSALPVAVLADDLESCSARMANSTKVDSNADRIDVKVAKVARLNRVWIRFHTRTDRAGIFAGLARALQSAGLSVRHASIMSDSTLGVYDWFEVKPPRSVKGLEAKLTRLLENSSEVAVDQARKIFDDIECLSQTESEWVISFRGKDTRGALLSAADALANEGLSIQWAKVHTWGRQIDDVFGVQSKGDLKIEDLLRALKGRVGHST